ncbi:uncharacterized protein LOC143570090 isoform X2 [Bidens hawaiensis]
MVQLRNTLFVTLHGTNFIILKFLLIRLFIFSFLFSHVQSGSSFLPVYKNYQVIWKHLKFWNIITSLEERQRFMKVILAQQVLTLNVPQRHYQSKLIHVRYLQSGLHSTLVVMERAYDMTMCYFHATSVKLSFQKCWLLMGRWVRWT